MTSAERKNRFEAAWKKAEAEAKDAKWRAEKAKNDFRKSDYGFWMDAYNEAKERAERLFNSYINA